MIVGLGVGAMYIGLWGCFVSEPNLGPAHVQLIVLSLVGYCQTQLIGPGG
jgi:hypothetical protein